MDYTYRLRKFNKVKSSIEKYLQRNLQRLPPTSERSLARALRNYFPEKPVNPALIRITSCNQADCECMVCTSNPSLMTGLSCPDIGHIHAPFLDLLSCLGIARFEPHYQQDNFYYPQDSFQYPQDNFSAHTR